MPEEDQDTAEVDKAPIVVGMILIPDHQPSEVPQPGEQPLHLPPSAVTPQGATILGFGLLSVAAVRGNHLYPLRSECGI